jgi:mannose-6-phosphate isomerase-like protein (cupin superfamily)
MEIAVINLEEKAGKSKDLHSYKLLAKMNNYDLKLFKARREFIWHEHEETDEVFFVVQGLLQIELRNPVHI